MNFQDDAFDPVRLHTVPMAVADPLYPGAYAPVVVVPDGVTNSHRECVLLFDAKLKVSPIQALLQARREAVQLDEA